MKLISYFALTILVVILLSLSYSVAATTALSISSITPSNPNVDSGQSITITAAWSGGTSPYTVTWYTGPDGTTCLQESANTLATYTGLSGTSNSLLVSPATTNSYCIGVTDSESPAVTQLSLNYSISAGITSGFNNPLGVAFSPSNTYAYVTNQNANNVVIINTATNTVISSITSGFNNPQEVAFSPGGTYAYVTNWNSNNAVIINTATNTVVNAITSGFNNPYGVAFSPSGTYAYVTNSGTGNVVIISTATNTVTGVINPFDTGGASGVAFSPSGTYAYVASSGSSNIAIINTATNTVTGYITSGFGNFDPEGVSFSPSGTYAYVVNKYADNVMIINTATNTVEGSIHVSFSYPEEAAFLPSGNYVYISNSGSNNMTIIKPGLGAETTNLIYSNITVNPALGIPSLSPSNPKMDSGSSVTLVASWTGGTPTYTVKWYTGPSGNTCTQDSANIIATHSSITGTSDVLSVSPTATNSYCVEVIDSASSPETTVSSTVDTSINSALSIPTLSPSNPSIDAGQSITLSSTWSGGTSTYGASLYSSSTSACDTESNLVQQAVGLTSNTITFSSISPDSSTYYCSFITDNTSDSYSVNSAITSGLSQPIGLAFSPSGTYAYVTNQNANNVVIINTATNTVVNAITSGFNAPIGVAFSPSGTYAYVINYNSNNVVIINTATNTVVNAIIFGISSPRGDVAFSPSGTYAYVANCGSPCGGVGNGNVVIINTATNTVSGAITSGFYYPVGIAFSPSGTYAYVANSGSSNVVIINTASNSVINSITSGINGPYGVAFAPSGTYAYVTNYNSNNVVIINTATNTVTSVIVSGMYNPSGVAFSPSGAYAYASDYYGTNNVMIINTKALTTNSITEEITVNPALSAPLISPSNPTIDSGQSVTFSSTWSGGTPDYTASLYSSTTSTCNSGSTLVQTQGSLTSGSTIFSSVSPTTATYYCISVSDSAATVSTTNSINSEVTVNPALAVPTLSPVSSTVDYGQSATLTAAWSGGSSPYTVTWYTGPMGNTCSQDSTNVLATYAGILGTSNSLQVSPATSNSYCIGITDSALSQETHLSSNAVVNIALNSTSKQVTNPYAGGSTGFFGHLPSATTITSSSTTTVTTTASTTSAVITVPVITASGTTAQVCNDTHGYSVNYPLLNSTFYFKPSASSCFNVTASNATSTYISSNSEIIRAINYSFSNSSILSNLTLHYPCNTASSALIPVILRNGTWAEINPFTVDAAACTITFEAPADPVIAVLYLTHSNSTNVTSATNTTVATIISNTTQQQPSINIFWVIAIVIVVIAILAVVYYINKRRSL